MAEGSVVPIDRKVVRKFKTEEDVAVALAKYIADLSDKFIKVKGSFTVVLSGGSLIDTMRKLVEPPYLHEVDWTKWYIFWVDERVVPLDSPDSNYKLAYDGFLSKVSIPSHQIYPIHYKPGPQGPEFAARDYEERLRKLVEKKILPLSPVTGFPIFDLMLLGMGPCGHVASLFPNRSQQHDKKDWVTFITDSPKPPPPRITFTFPVINSATEIAMVVTGLELSLATHVVLKSNHHDFGLKGPLPAQKVSAEGLLTWFLDENAAFQL